MLSDDRKWQIMAIIAVLNLAPGWIIAFRTPQPTQPHPLQQASPSTEATVTLAPFVITGVSSVISCSLLLAFGLICLRRRKDPEVEDLKNRGKSEDRRKQVDALRDKRSALEGVAFSNLKNRFEHLPLAQKIALRRICEYVSIHELGLSAELESDGFGERQDVLRTVIQPLTATDFVEINSDGMLVPSHSRLRDIDEIVLNWKY